MKRRSLSPTLPITLVAAACGLCACTSGPLAPTGADRGAKVDEQLLKRINRFAPEQFAAPDAAPPTPDGDASAPSSPLASRTPPPSRLSGMTDRALTVEEVRAATLANNLDLKVSLIDPVIASESLRAEKAKFESVFSPRIGYREDDSPTLDITNANTQDSVFGSMGVDIPLRTGGRASIDLTENFSQTNNPFFTFNDAYSNALQFSISQPLLRNAGRKVNEQSILIAAINRQIVDAGTKLSVIRVIAASDRAYWRLDAVRRALDVAQQQYELARVQVEQAQRRVDAGDAAEIEVIRAEAGLASRLEAIVIAENAVITQQRELKRLMNLPDLEMDTNTLLRTATEPTPIRFDLPAAELTEHAVANRMEMLQLELQIAADASNVDFARNQTLPLVALDYNYTISGLGGSFYDAHSVLRDHNFESWQAGLSAQFPIGNEQAKSRLESAILQRLQRLAGKDAQEQSIRQETLNAIDQVTAGWQRILASRQSVIASARALDGERRQFDAGARTSTDVLDAAASLAEAQLAEIRSLTDYQIALVDLAFATGTLLGASDVDWQANDPRQ